MSPDQRGGRGDGLAGRPKEPWTLDRVRKRAGELGKPFELSLDEANRVAGDLETGALVLFTEDEVDQAVENGLVPADKRGALRNLVSPDGANNIAVVRAETATERNTRELTEWFMTNNRC